MTQKPDTAPGDAATRVDASAAGTTSPADPEAHRLHRDPEAVDGLQPDKADDRTETAAAETRAATGRKPYTAETEGYGNDSLQPPDDPGQRAEATRPPRR